VPLVHQRRIPTLEQPSHVSAYTLSILKTHNPHPSKSHIDHHITMHPKLNPIACEPCRSKKCKCDRTLFVPALSPTHPIALTFTDQPVRNANLRIYAATKKAGSAAFPLRI
jgi:hypothetical protein